MCHRAPLVPRFMTSPSETRSLERRQKKRLSVSGSTGGGLLTETKTGKTQTAIRAATKAAINTLISYTDSGYFSRGWNVPLNVFQPLRVLLLLNFTAKHSCRALCRVLCTGSRADMTYNRTARTLTRDDDLITGITGQEHNAPTEGGNSFTSVAIGSESCQLPSRALVYFL